MESYNFYWQYEDYFAIIGAKSSNCIFFTIFFFKIISTFDSNGISKNMIKTILF